MARLGWAHGLARIFGCRPAKRRAQRRNAWSGNHGRRPNRKPVHAHRDGSLVWHGVQGARSAGRELVPGQATFALVMVEALLMTLRSLGSVTWPFRQAM